MTPTSANNDPGIRGAVARKSATAFITGQTMYVRYKFGNIDRIIPVMCKGVALPSSDLIVQWTEDSAQISPAPPDGTKVQCQMLNSGELFLANGQIIGSASGKLPRVRIKIGESCVGVKLRRQQRFAVRGKLEILESGGAVFFAHNNFQKMNISLGGFGTRLSQSAAANLKFTGFRLEVYVETDAQPDDNYPALILDGEVELRHSKPSSQEGMVYAGFQFSKLSDIAMGTLQFWLATHGQVLRAL